MSFWNKNKLPAEYQNLSEDQISELLKKGKEAEDEKLRLETTSSNALAEKKKAEDRAKELEAQLAARPEPKTEDEDENERRRQIPNGPPDAATWLTDPNSAFNSAVAPTAAVALHGAIISARLLADQFIRQQGPVNARLWNKYGGEVAALVDKLPPDQRILPQSWINQFTFVKGMHLDDVVKEGQKEGEAFFSETAGSTGRGLPEDQHKNDDTLTDAELKIAKRMGTTPERYLAQKKKMQFGPALN
jgi:hypothetical protein